MPDGSAAADPRAEVDEPTMTVVVVTWNGRDDLQRCLAGLAAQTVPHEVVVVDNGSSDGTLDLPELRRPGVTVVALPANVGFATGANEGVRRVRTEWFALLNNDATPRPDWLERLAAAVSAAASDVGFVASKLVLDGTGRLDSVGDDVDRAFTARPRGHGARDDGSFDRAATVISACGGAAAFRHDMWTELGGMSDDFFAYFEDADLCLRARLLGWTGRLAADAVVDHRLSSTSGRIPGFKRYQGVRNSWYLFVRCVPGALAWRAVPLFLVTQAVWLAAAVKAGEVGPVLRAYRDVLRHAPRLLKERRAIQRSVRIPAARLWDELSPAVELARLRGARP